jgi:putative transposase
MGTYTEAFYHFVWATRKREWFVTDEIERPLYRYIEQRCSDLHVAVHAINGMPDHVHLAVSLLATLAPAEFMNTVKGTSAHFVNHRPETKGCLYWQPGYGLLTFAYADLPRIIDYITRQKQHHAAGKLSPKMERAADWENRLQKSMP